MAETTSSAAIWASGGQTSSDRAEQHLGCDGEDPHERRHMGFGERDRDSRRRNGAFTAGAGQVQYPFNGCCP
ncbi:hypothetical protein ACFYPT_35560 [Streptomyces sp. NPDC005529]|uniref:hypothetical protein n=1 Tax=unclassified Streptomyces TaxID=2593676 RepID=UPI0033A6B39D